MRRTIIAALLALTGALPALAQGQFPQTLPANTVYGRLGIGPGPGQAIPFQRLQTVLGGATGDCIISFATGVAKTICTKTNDVPFGTMAVQNAPTVAITGGTITGMPTPAASSDVATKAYVDTVAAGTGRVHPAVRLATTTTLPANTYANGTLGVGATLTCNSNVSVGAIDGTTPSAGDRILVKDEAAGSHNGPYTITTVGNGSTPCLLTRATDGDTTAEMSGGDLFLVTAGTLNINTGWVNTTTSPTMGTTAIVFAQSSAGGGNQWFATGSDIQNNNGGTVKIGNTLTMLGNVLLNGHWLSGDGGNEGVFVDSSGNVGVGTSSLAVAGAGIVAGRTYLNIQGSTAAGAIEMTTASADADTAVVGAVQFTDKNSLASDKRVANIAARLDGTTANNRGGALTFGTKPDAGSLAEVARFTKDGRFGLGTASPTAQLHTTGTVRFAGVSGAGTAGCVKNDTSGNLSAGNSCGAAVIYPAVTCDGVADNTTIIQAALDTATALGGAVVELPNGQCLSGSLIVGYGTWFRGQTQGAYRGLAQGTTLLAKTGLGQLVSIAHLGSRVSSMWLKGNPTSGWAIVNNPGNSAGDSLANPSLVDDVSITGFSQAGGGGIITNSGTINVERSQFNANNIHFYSYDANIGGRFISNNVQFGGEGGWQAIWTNHGNSNEGHIIRDNNFVGSQAEGVWIETCVLCYFENNVVGNTVGTRDLAVSGGNGVHMVGNWFDKKVEIANLLSGWFMRNQINQSSILSVSGPHTLVMMNVFTAACTFGASVTALINTGHASCNTTTAVPTTW